MNGRRPAWAGLPFCPSSLTLEGKRAVVIGGTAAAAWKAELLAAAGANVAVYAPLGQRSAELSSLPDATIEIIDRSWSREAMADAAIVVADAADMAEGQAIADAARAGRHPGQYHRPSDAVAVPVRLDRQSLAGGDRHLDRGRHADPGSGDPPASGKHAAGIAGRMGGFGAKAATVDRRDAAVESGQAVILGKPRDSRLRPAACGRCRADAARSRDAHAVCRFRRFRARHPGRGWPRRCRAADVEGAARAAGSRCHPVRRSGIRSRFWSWRDAKRGGCWSASAAVATVAGRRISTR